MFDVDFTFLWTLLNLLVLFFILRKALFGRISAFLEKRARRIGDELERAEKEEAAARSLRDKYEKRLHDAEAEGAAIIERATGAAEARAERIVEAARAEAERIVEGARRHMQSERQAAVLAFKAQAAALALAAAGRVLRREINADDNKRIAEAALRELGVDGL